MRLYHYTTWPGWDIFRKKFLQPSDKYGNFVTNTQPPTMLSKQWPKLVWLSKSDEWEPSVQTISPQGYWEKCGSDPDAYTELGIPCWRFEISLIGLLHMAAVDQQPLNNRWLDMLKDGRKLGSDLYNWHLTNTECDVVESCMRIDGKWRVM